MGPLEERALLPCAPMVESGATPTSSLVPAPRVTVHWQALPTAAAALNSLLRACQLGPPLHPLHYPPT